MTHRLRVQRHTVVAVLASAATGAALMAIVQRSWVLGIVAALSAAGLLVLEIQQIEEEDKEEAAAWEPTEVPEPAKEDGVRIPDVLLEGIRVLARNEPTKHVTEERRPFYDQGLADGAAEFARFILDQMEEESD